MIHPDLPKKMEFLLIVSDPGIARFAYDSGVARLFVDLEYIGKDQRQKGLDTWKSKQSPADVTRFRESDAQTLEANRIAKGARVRDVVTLIRNKRST